MRYNPDPEPSLKGLHFKLSQFGFEIPGGIDQSIYKPKANVDEDGEFYLPLGLANGGSDLLSGFIPLNVIGKLPQVANICADHLGLDIYDISSGIALHPRSNEPCLFLLW